MGQRRAQLAAERRRCHGRPGFAVGYPPDITADAEGRAGRLHLNGGEGPSMEPSDCEIGC